MNANDVSVILIALAVVGLILGIIISSSRPKKRREEMEDIDEDMCDGCSIVYLDWELREMESPSGLYGFFCKPCQEEKEREGWKYYGQEALQEAMKSELWS